MLGHAGGGDCFSLFNLRLDLLIEREELGANPFSR